MDINIIYVGLNVDATHGVLKILLRSHRPAYHRPNRMSFVGVKQPVAHAEITGFKRQLSDR